VESKGAKYLLIFSVLLAVLVPTATASAGVFLGTLADNSCIAYQASTGEQVFFCDADIRPTGTGYFDPFLRVGRDGSNGNPADSTESTYSSGWNTDATHQMGVDGFNDFDHSWTSSLPLSDVSLVNTVPTGAWGGGATDYALFTVDINQKASEGSDLLTLNQMVLYNCNDNDNITLAAACTSFFNLFGNTGDFINFDYRLHTGSGSGDVDVYIRNNAGFAGPYIELLDGWGCGSGPDVPNAYRCNRQSIVADNDGFQEWATTKSNPPQNVVPEPASLLLLGSGISAGLAARRKARKSKQQ